MARDLCDWMAADPGAEGAGMSVYFSGQHTLFGGQTSLGLWSRREKACLHLETPPGQERGQTHKQVQ